MDFSSVAVRSADARALQAMLLTLYSSQDDVALLTDGIIGRATKQSAERFCREFDLIVNSKSGNDASTQLLGAMNSFIKITADNPDWRERVNSAEFDLWLDAVGPRDAPPYVAQINLKSSAVARVFLLEAFKKREVDPVSDVVDVVDGLFVIDDAALALLQALGNVSDLEGVSADGRSALRDALAAKLGVDASEVSAFIDTLVAGAEIKSLYKLNDQPAELFKASGLTAVPPETVSSLTQFAVESESALADFIVGAFRQVESDGKSASTDAEAPALNVSQLRRAIRGNTVPVTEYRVTKATLDALPVTKEQTALPAGALEKLADMKDVRFGNADLFRTALRVEAGIVDPGMIAAIVSIAKRSEGVVSTRDLGLTPMIWEGGGCGCGVFETLDASYPSHLYGLFGFWEAPQSSFVDDKPDPAFEPPDPTTIDFSLLARIGYYGVTIDSSGAIREPLHFQQATRQEGRWFWQRDSYSAFVERAHQFKTRVDLVVYNMRWGPWLPADKSEETFDRSFSSPLQKSVQQKITRPLGGFANILKPVISAGNSPRRTLGDGVTFDFNFAGVPEEDQVWLYDRMASDDGFFGDLKGMLNPESNWPADVAYAINLVVPMQCLVGAEQPLVNAQERTQWMEKTGCAFFAIDRLVKLEHVDLFLIDDTRGGGGIDAMQRLRENVDGLRTDDQVGFLRKVVPLVTTNRAQRFDAQQLKYLDWNFAGLATWGVNEDDATAGRLRSAFTEQGRHLQTAESPTGLWSTLAARVASVESAVCNATCPKRWWLRTAIFFIAVAALIYAFASYWILQLRALYDTRAFAWGVILAAAILILTLWCDPFWSRQKSAILFVSLLAALVAWSIARHRRLRAQYYP